MDADLKELLHLLHEEELIRLRRRAEKRGKRELIEILSAELDGFVHPVFKSGETQG